MQNTDHWPAALQPNLSCLVVGEALEHVTDASNRLLRSSRVGHVEVLADEIALGHELAARRHDLIVLILEAPDAALPRTLLKHPEVRVLVVAPDGVRGTLARWLQQGADDLVSPEDEDAYDHALSRLLDACSLSATTRRQAVVIDVQRQRIQAMISRTAGRQAATPDRHKHRDGGVDLLRKTRRATPDSVPQRTEKHGERDGLPGRQATMKRLLALAARPYQQSTTAIAVQVTLPFASGGRPASRLDNTIADLAVYRAADALRCLAPKRLLIGRIRQNRLIILFEARRADDAYLNRLDQRVRAQFGTLCGLLGSAEEVELDIVAAPLAGLAVPSLIDRLEKRYDSRQPQRESATDQTETNDTLVPVVTARVEAVRPPLAAAQS